jgi:hypothetical protein
MMKFKVTYQTVTPESAEHGDFADSGFVTPGGGHYPVNDCGDMTITLREAMKLACPSCDCGGWFAEESEGRVNYRTGAVETRSIHPPMHITASSYLRVRRALGIK